MTPSATSDASTTPVAEPEPRARFRDLVAAEWLKLWSLRSTCWTLLLCAVAFIGLNVSTAYSEYAAWPDQSAEFKAEFVPNTAMLDAATKPATMVLVLLIGAFGTLAIVGEHHTGLIRTTFAAVPARRSLLAAKMAVVTAVTTIFGALVAVISFTITQALLSERDAGLSFGDPGVARALTATALLAPLTALIGLAIGATVRHSAASVVAAVAVLLLLPNTVGDRSHTSAVMHNALPYNAWIRLTQSTPWSTPWPTTTTEAWLVYPAWALVAVVLALAVVGRRDQ